jgi:hypothetical protein
MLARRRARVRLVSRAEAATQTRGHASALVSGGLPLLGSHDEYRRVFNPFVALVGICAGSLAATPADNLHVGD